MAPQWHHNSDIVAHTTSYITIVQPLTMDQRGVREGGAIDHHPTAGGAGAALQFYGRERTGLRPPPFAQPAVS